MSDSDFFACGPVTDDINLPLNLIVRGESLNLTTRDAELTEIVVGLGWDLKPFDADPIDLDASCFLLDKNDQTRANEDFVFYNNISGAEGSVVHNGDSRTGAGDGDDETITINLHNLSFDIIRIVFVLSIHEGLEKCQTLDRVQGGFLRVVDKYNAHEIIRYNLESELVGRTETGLIVAALERQGPNWIFCALGDSISGGLAEIAKRYGLIVAE